MAKRTKIICTLGPAVDNEKTLTHLIEAGMDIARLNFSHGNHAEHKERLDRLKALRKKLDVPCATLLDTRGPEIRTGSLAGGKPVALTAGSSLTLTERVVEGTAAEVSQSCIGLATHLAPGSIILMDDGLIELRVEAMHGTDVLCTVQNDGMLGERKSINVPGVSVPLPTMTDQDRSDLLFSIEQDMDFVAASFVRNASAVREIKEFLAENGGSRIGVIAKIENEEAVDDIEGIIDASDGIMVARGDLGVEIPAFQVPHIQKKIINLCNARSKPVITATQMLDSMMRNPRPTRAEASDVANAVYDGTDCLMLSGETAIGAHPVEAVQMMARIAEASEAYLAEKDSPGNSFASSGSRTVSLAVGTAAVKTADALCARCIVAPTQTGRSARLISSLRPRKPIYAVTPSKRVMRSMQLCWGVTPLLGDVEGDTDYAIAHARNEVMRRGLVRPGDIAVFTVGDRDTSPKLKADALGNAGIAPTNIMYVVQIHEDDASHAKS